MMTLAGFIFFETTLARVRANMTLDMVYLEVDMRSKKKPVPLFSAAPEVSDVNLKLGREK